MGNVFTIEEIELDKEIIGLKVYICNYEQKYLSVTRSIGPWKRIDLSDTPEQFIVQDADDDNVGIMVVNSKRYVREFFDHLDTENGIDYNRKFKIYKNKHENYWFIQSVNNKKLLNSINNTINFVDNFNDKNQIFYFEIVPETIKKIKNFILDISNIFENFSETTSLSEILTYENKCNTIEKFDETLSYDDIVSNIFIQEKGIKINKNYKFTLNIKNLQNIINSNYGSKNKIIDINDTLMNNIDKIIIGKENKVIDKKEYRIIKKIKSYTKIVIKNEKKISKYIIPWKSDIELFNGSMYTIGGILEQNIISNNIFII